MTLTTADKFQSFFDIRKLNYKDMTDNEWFEYLQYYIHMPRCIMSTTYPKKDFLVIILPVRAWDLDSGYKNFTICRKL